MTVIFPAVNLSGTLFWFPGNYRDNRILKNNTYVNRAGRHRYMSTELSELEIITTVIMMHLTRTQ
jgi:hypothetical protein